MSPTNADLRGGLFILHQACINYWHGIYLWRSTFISYPYRDVNILFPVIYTAPIYTTALSYPMLHTQDQFHRNPMNIWVSFCLSKYMQKKRHDQRGGTHKLHCCSQALNDHKVPKYGTIRWMQGWIDSPCKIVKMTIAHGSPPVTPAHTTLNGLPLPSAVSWSNAWQSRCMWLLLSPSMAAAILVTLHVIISAVHTLTIKRSRRDRTLTCRDHCTTRQSCRLPQPGRNGVLAEASYVGISTQHRDKGKVLTWQSDAADERPRRQREESSTADSAAGCWACPEMTLPGEDEQG